jgi:hypothetical protein
MSDTGTTEPTAARRVAGFLGAAAKLAQKQAELATLNTVTLPKLYHAIGKYLMAVAKLPPDLEQRRAAIQQLEAQSAAAQDLEEARDPGKSASGFAAKATQFAQQAARKAAKATGDAARSAQIQASYVALGKAAVEKYGEKAAPQPLRPQIAEQMTRLVQLRREIAELSKGSFGHWFTPMRGLQVGGIAISLLIIWLFLLPGGRGSIKGSATPLGNRPAASAVDEVVQATKAAVNSSRVTDPPELFREEEVGAGRGYTPDRSAEAWKLVPPEAKALLEIDVRGVVQSPSWQKSQEALARSAYGQNSLAILDMMEAKYGFRYDRDIDRVVVAFPIPKGELLEGVLCVVFGDFKPERVSVALAALDGAAVSTWRGFSVFAIPQDNDRSAYLAFVSSKCAVIALEADVVRQAILRAEKSSGGVSPPIAAAMKSRFAGAHAHLGIDPAAFSNAPQGIKELSRKAEWASVTFDSSRAEPRALATVRARSSKDAAEWEKWFEQNVLRDKTGNENFQRFSGGSRPLSEAVQVLRNGQTVNILIKDFR